MNITTPLKKISDSQLRFMFYTLWFVVLLIQARYTELFSDEAYYWNYSTNLAWGYFDHPPVIAFLIKCGYYLFPNELGVRLFPVILNTLTIFILEKIINPKDLRLFYVIVSSSFFLQIAGMLAIPDTPMLFFTATFFLLYKRYLERESFLTAILIGLNIGVLLLSKYHGILVVGFTILSNIKLLRKWHFWVTAALAMLCVLPHLLWQFHNNFPTVRFQLFERPDEGFDLNNTLQYITAQPFVFGPVISLILLILCFKFKPASKFESALRYNLIGVYAFFLFMTFKQRVEAHWTLIAIIPMIYMGYSKLQFHNLFKKITYYAFYVTVVLLVAVRIFFMYDYLPSTNLTDDFKSEYHGWKTWATIIKNLAKGKPVVFMNGYKEASQYKFYSGGDAITLNNIMGHKTEYDIWKYENAYQGKDVLLIPNYTVGNLQTIETPKGKDEYMFINNFRSYSTIKITHDDNKVVVNKAQPFTVKIGLEALPEDLKYIDVQSNKDYKAFISYTFFTSKSYVSETFTDFTLTNDMLNNNKTYDLNITPPKEPGDYVVYLAIRSGWLPPSISSKKLRVIVK